MSTFSCKKLNIDPHVNQYIKELVYNRLIMLKSLILIVAVAIISFYFTPIATIIRKGITNQFYPVSDTCEHVEWKTYPNINNEKKKTPPSLPNIILIVADDLGINDVRDSPNIKSIYNNGVRFKNAYSTQATCAPSRASLYTGRFPTTMGIEFTPHPVSLDLMMYFQNDTFHPTQINISTAWNNPSMEHLSLNKNETLISNVLHDNNYSNYFVGKWHLGEQDGYRPLERGFDESLSFLIGASMYAEEDDPNVASVGIERSVFDTYMSKWIPFGISHNNKKLFKPDAYMTDYLTERTTDLIKAHRDETDPFFITLAYNAPHNPYQALKSDYDMEEGEHHEKVYKGMIRALDRGVGNILQTLKDEGKYDNTLIMFTSDNGGTHLIGIDDINYPYNGWKCTFFDGGTHIPMFWQWPNMIPAGVEYDKTVSHVDIFSTIASLVGYKSDIEDGVNLLPYISGEDDTIPHETLFWRSADYRSIKVNEWKLSVSDFENKTWFFNLDEDMEEKHNLMQYVNFNSTVRYHYDIMLQKLAEINSQQMDPLWHSPMMMPIPIYGPEINSEEDEYVYWSI